jgi:hypothetical protein
MISKLSVVQDLVSADSSSKVTMKEKDVLGASEDDGARKVVAEPAFVGVNPDAEAEIFIYFR